MLVKVLSKDYIIAGLKATLALKYKYYTLYRRTTKIYNINANYIKVELGRTLITK